MSDKFNDHRDKLTTNYWIKTLFHFWTQKLNTDSSPQKKNLKVNYLKSLQIALSGL